MNKILWIDLGVFATFLGSKNVTEVWQDHGLGLMRTILHKNNILTDIVSLKSMNDWEDLKKVIAGYDILLMNVRSYSFAQARESAKIFKEYNPKGIVITGGMHASVSLHEMEEVQEFDYICVGGGEEIIVDLVTNPTSFPRVIKAVSSKSINDWPDIDRTLWPNPNQEDYPWPLESAGGLGESPMASVITSRVCPWQCSFCNELSYIPSMARKSVDRVIDELNFLDDNYGPIKYVVIHDSMFFQQPSWLKEWLDKYPKRANKVWPYWAAARSDTIRKWPELFEKLIRQTNWDYVSVGFESGSDKVLKILNKGCTAEDNLFAIDLLNKIGDDYVNEGKTPPKFWANIMFAIPGETEEDALATHEMQKRMKYARFTTSFFAAYPGSALGNQVIAENKSLLKDNEYNRYVETKGVKNINYGFYRNLTSGPSKQARMNVVPMFWQKKNVKLISKTFFLFNMKNGKKKLSYGDNVDDAYEILSYRLSPEEMQEIIKEEYTKVLQQDLQKIAKDLG